MRINLQFWRSGKQALNVVKSPKRVKIFRPWQIRQWLGLDDKGKTTEFRKKVAAIESLQTRQRKRHAFRVIAHEQINKQYGPEPRHARRGIALVLARKAYREHMNAA